MPSLTRYPVLLGDCNSVMASLQSETFDLIVTDPPYGIRYRSNHQTSNSSMSCRPDKTGTRKDYFQQIAGDTALPTNWLSEGFRLLKDGTALYVFCHWTKWSELVLAVGHTGFRVKSMIVLAKSNHGMGDWKGGYAPKHELLLFATKGRHLIEGKRIPDVWHVPVKYSGAIRLHPNEKPESWVEPAIRQSSREGSRILDPFGGSGTVAACAKKLGRSCTTIEIDPLFIPVIRDRLETVKQTC